MKAGLGRRGLEDLQSKVVVVAVPELKAPTSGVFPTQKLQGKGLICSLVGHRAIQAHHRVPQTKGGENLGPGDSQWAPTTEDLHHKVLKVILDHHITTHNRLWQCKLWHIGKSILTQS